MADFVKISPSAANAFEVEVYNYLGKIAYVLHVHTDGDRLEILPKQADGKATTLTATIGYSHESQQEVEFAVLNIKPLQPRK